MSNVTCLSSEVPISYADPVCENSAIVFRCTSNPVVQDYVINSVLFVLVMVMVPCCVLYFQAKRRLYRRLRNRPPLLVASVGFGLILFAITGPLAAVFPFTSYPCWFRMICIILIPGVVGGVMVVKLLIFQWLTVYSNLAAEKAKEDPKPWSQVNRKRLSPLRHGWRFTITGLALLFNLKHPDKEQTLSALKFLTTPTGTLLIMFLGDLPYLVLALVLLATQPAYLSNCTGCLVAGFFDAYLAICVVLIAATFALGVLTYRMQDFWGLKSEVRHIAFALTFTLVGFCVAFISSDRTVINIGVIMQTIGFISVLLVVSVLQVYTAERKEGRMLRRRPTSLTVPGGGWTVDNVLGNPEMAKMFELHLVKEFGVESLLFIRAIEEWNTHFAKSSSDQQRARAAEIVADFIDASGRYSINISSKIHDQVQKEALVEVVPQNVFDDALDEIKFLLQNDSLSRFVASEQFAQIQAYAPHRRRE